MRVRDGGALSAACVGVVGTTIIGPLQDNVTAFRKRYPDTPDAQELADHIQEEIDMWHAYSEFYGYEFFVLRAR